MAKSQNLPPPPGPPKSAFSFIFKGVQQFLGGPFFLTVCFCFCLFFIGFAYFSVVLAVLGFGHIVPLEGPNNLPEGPPDYPEIAYKLPRRLYTLLEMPLKDL